MTTCEICGRGLDATGDCCPAYYPAQDSIGYLGERCDPHTDPEMTLDCYRLGYEREKARAERLEKVSELNELWASVYRFWEFGPGIDSRGFGFASRDEYEAALDAYPNQSRIQILEAELNGE